MDQQNISRFPEQSEPNKFHGTSDESNEKEKYMRDSGKIEDYPENHGTPKTTSDIPKDEKKESAHLKDRSGEEKDEDYINTDERLKDLQRKR
jgi:hypothetical protein